MFNILSIHYYTRFKSNGGGTIASGSSNNSLKAMVDYFNTKFLADLGFQEWLGHWRKCNASKDIDNYIISCNIIKQSIVQLMTQNPSISFEDILAGNLSNSDVDILNTQVPSGRYYIASDWPLLFSLCELNKQCIVLESRINIANAAGAQDNACNLVDFMASLPNFQNDFSTTAYFYPCWDFSLFTPCNLEPPFGVSNISCTVLTTEVANFMYKLTDPNLYYDPITKVFHKGQYLADLRTHLNIYFSTASGTSINLSICDYNTLLETCEPCCYQNFFEKIDYEFLLYWYQQRFAQINNKLYSGTYGYHVDFQKMYDDNALYCNRGFITKVNMSTNANVKKYEQYNKGIVGYYPGLFPNEYDVILAYNLLLVTVNKLDNMGILINTGNDGCSVKSPCTAPPPKKMKKPKCDVSDCDAFIAAYNAAKARRIFDKTVDFDEWWDAIYWEMIDDLFGDGDYMTKEELKLKLLCCGIDIYEDIIPPCDKAFRLIFEEFVNRFKPGGFPNPKQIQDYFNDYFGIDETLAYWITKLSVAPCNLLGPDGGDDCAFFKNNFFYELWDKGGDVDDVIDGLNEDYNLDRDGLLDKIKQCYNCNEIREMFLNAPPL